MSTTAILLDEMRAAGVTLVANGEQLKIQAARDIITPELTARLKEFKPQLLAILADGSAHRYDATETEPAGGLQLLLAIAEFDALIERLCDLRGFNDGVRRDMESVRRCMSPEAIRQELSAIRKQVELAEARPNEKAGRHL